MTEPAMITRTAHYIWGGWGAISVLLVALAAWEWAAGFQSELILPSPLDVLAHLAQLLVDPEAWRTIGITARRALLGFSLAWVVGGGLGLLAGRTIAGAVISRPLISVLLGTPPIAWLVLVLRWFGSGDGSPMFTVFIACLPVMFLQSMQGSRTLSLQYHDLACNYELNARQRWLDINLPHILSYLLPATITALGVAWKVVVMAELLAADEGVGAMLAVSRSRLDTTGALAWILTTVGLLLTEYLVLEPLTRHLERWQMRES